MIEFAILGRQFRALGVGPELERWLRWHWQLGAGAEPHHFRIEVEVVARLPPSVSGVQGAQVVAALDGVRQIWHCQGARSWRMGGVRAGVELRIHPGLAHVNVWDRDGVATRGEILVALQVALCEALRATRLVPLHAAVVTRDGRAVAFLGPRGAGKSTTVLSAMARGWAPIAEDFAWLDPTTRWVYGWDRGVRLTEDGVRRVRPEWRSEGWRREGDGKLFLAYERLAESRLKRAELVRLAILHRDATRRSGWESVTAREAVRALWESAGVPLCPLTRKDLAGTVVPLLGALEVRRLVLGAGATLPEL